jgi:ribosomal-protein-alanine N-acetyltransferase
MVPQARRPLLRYNSESAWEGAGRARKLTHRAMWLFRKSLDLSRAAPRSVAADDLTAVSRLLRDGGRRYYGLAGSDLPILLGEGRGVALAADGELWGVAMVGWPAQSACWLRAVALAEGVEARPALALMLPALHQALAGRGLSRIYFAGDETTDGWLAPLLRAAGYQSDTEVIVYEKQDLDIPDGGNPAVAIRPVGPGDLAAVLRIDELCFEPQWQKDDTILAPAIEQGPYFVLAELAGEPVGYAYATAHFGGRLVHLVRIAVDPRRRGERVGVRLLADLVAFAEESGALTLTLNTQAYNTNAQRLYRWFGFAPTGERQIVLRCILQGDAIATKD